MEKRQQNKKNKNKSKKPINDDSTFSTPKIVVEPKTERAKKAKNRQVNREKNELHLKTNYLDNIQKLSPIDLGIINDTANSSGYYPENKKKDRHYNRGIQRAKDDLRLLSFFTRNLKPYYRHQIFSSSEFLNVIQQYQGIDDFLELTREEKDQALASASQMLINSMTIIKNHMPPEFSEILKHNGKPFFDLVNAITKFKQAHNFKNIPDIQIPDSLR